VVIGAGSVVTKNIPSNVLVVGVPATIIKSIEDYKLTSAKLGHSTKLMSAAQKKRYYTSCSLISGERARSKLSFIGILSADNQRI